MLLLIKERCGEVKNKVIKAICNKRGDISKAGKMVITCIALLAILGVTVYAISWVTSRVESTTNKIDQEFEQWNN